MIKSLFKNFFDSNEKAIKKVMPLVQSIKEQEQKLQDLKDEDLVAIVDKMREEIKEMVEKIPQDQRESLVINKGSYLKSDETKIREKLQTFIPEFFAIVNEVYKRKVNIHYFDVQYIAGAILSQGYKLIELKTGEGKTMVFQLPAFLYALTGRGSHVITVNDYLAKVGGEYAGHIAQELGFSVGVITPQANYKFISDDLVKKIKGQEEYDNMKKYQKENKGIKISNMRGYNLVEVDKKEAYQCDIVYGTNNEFGFDYLRDNMATNLEDIKQGELYFAIIDEADSILIDEARTPLIISAPAAASNELYKKFALAVKKLKAERDYTIDEKAHSAVLSEEGILAMEKILGVSNIWEDYQFAHHLDNALKALALYKKDVDYLIRDNEILIVDQFTGRVLPGRRYSEGLHQAIEAKEGVEIKKESKTLATITFQNFFRLYKIIGGGSGTIMTEAEEFFKIYGLDSVEVPTNEPVIRKDKTDRVYKNRKAKFDAVAEEIKRVHKSGQPVLVGTTSIEDSEYLSSLVEKMGLEHEVLNAKNHAREAQIVSKAGEKGAITIATNMAGRGTDIPLGKGVVEVGGLYVIGTQRHEARRIDNQLRGRSGRQGDPGESRFFVSLDDDIMRIQGGHIVQRIMEMTNIPDNVPIETGLIGRSIEGAQKKMENMHFDSRKRVVEYDDVMNQQREIFYSKRKNHLTLCENAVGTFLKGREVIKKEKNDPLVTKAHEQVFSSVQDKLFLELDNIINIHLINSKDSQEELDQFIKDFLDFAPDENVKKALNKLRSIDFDETQMPVTDLLKKHLIDKSEEQVKEYLQNILRALHNLKKETLSDKYNETVKLLYLENMDNLWTEHLESMQDLREGIGLRGYAQRDPLVEYKNEGYRLFDELIVTIDSNLAKRLLKIENIRTSNRENLEIKTNEESISDLLEGSREMLTSINNVLKSSNSRTPGKQGNAKKQERQKTVINSAKANIGRNDPCYCGSGKKYKKCHGRNL